MDPHLHNGWSLKLDHSAFILANTEIQSPPLVQEVHLHLAHEALPIWQKTEDELGAIGLPPPFWAFAWAGGQALARYIIDHPEIVRGRNIIDLASGSGLVAIAALKAGAARVLAADIDEFAASAIKLNAARNGVTLGITRADLLLTRPDAEVILVGDLFYEKEIASRCYAWLLNAHMNGVAVLIGDPGRTYLPKDKLTNLATYSVPVSRDLEDTEIKKTSVWTLKS
jgi:predicted nicotinamide N-methyase